MDMQKACHVFADGRYGDSLIHATMTLAWSTPQRQSIDFLGIGCYSKNSAAKTELKRSTPILGQVGGDSWHQGGSRV